MADRPIIFSGPMVRALMEGRKTQTRRVLKDQDTWTRAEAIVKRYPRQNGLPWAPGDRLWVRETWADVLGIIFAADYPAGDPAYRPQKGWRSPIHMPRWASRLTLIVEDVRVQRLQEITSADAIREGFPPYANSTTIDCDTPDPRDDFKSTWNSLHGPEAWDANPFVAALTFRVERANIDTL